MTLSDVLNKYLMFLNGHIWCESRIVLSESDSPVLFESKDRHVVSGWFYLTYKLKQTIKHKLNVYYDLTLRKISI